MPGYFSAGGGGGAGAPVVIAEQTLAAAATHIEFASIPGTYEHLRIAGRLRSDAAATNRQALLRVGNGTVDAGTNYRGFALQFNLTTATTEDNATAGAQVIPGRCTGATADADVWGLFDFTIEDYADPTYWRAMHGTNWMHTSTTEAVTWLWNGHWKNKTAAIDVVRVLLSADNFVAGSRLRLIGIPGPA